VIMNTNGILKYSCLLVLLMEVIAADPVQARGSASVDNPKKDSAMNGMELASKPPMGWNSWDCYGTSVTEKEVKANAAAMKKDLARFGWEYIVVDIQWYEPRAKAGGYRPDAVLEMDEYGRLIPAPNRFPSSRDGKGFKPLADHIHSLGLKFGIHILRGIPRQAVLKNTPILGTKFCAKDIADPKSVCPWNTDMVGLDMSKPGAQAYVDSIVSMYAAWGVDFIKADDMAAPVYHASEIEALSKAIARCGRPMVLSLSPGGGNEPSNFKHLRGRAQMWRVSDDLWDSWGQLKPQFENASKWRGLGGPGHWPDLDMLPLGRISIRGERGRDRWSLLTRVEQRTLMTLWAIFRSPLMMGGDLPSLDGFTRSLLTNPAVLEVNQASKDNAELMRREGHVAWGARSLDDRHIYVALFNLRKEASRVELPLAALDASGRSPIVDLWGGKNRSPRDGMLSVVLPAHGSGLYRLEADPAWYQTRKDTAFKLKPTPVKLLPSVLWRVRAGTEEPLRYSDGEVWSGDLGYLGGNAVETDRPIRAKSRRGLYQTERWGPEVVYTLPVTTGRYRVRLFFAETYVRKVGERVFDIWINGKRVLEDFDILKEAGAFETGVVREFTGISPSKKGTIQIKLVAKTQNAKVCAVEIVRE